jgi:hypothetical protein
MGIGCPQTSYSEGAYSQSGIENQKVPLMGVYIYSFEENKPRIAET